MTDAITETDADEQEDDFEEEDLDEIVRAKWVMDGAKTFSEAATLLRAEADRLEALEADGFQLTRPVEDDYGFYRKTDG